MSAEKEELVEEKNDSDEDSDNRKWVGVRLSKVMMNQVEDTVKAHPEWAWSNNSDFIRDAVRRLLEQVRTQESIKAHSLSTLPKRVLDVAKETLDPGSYSQFRKDLLEIMASMDFDRDPSTFLDASTDTLAKYLGETLAQSVVKNLYEELL